MRLSLQQRIEASHDDSVWAAHWSPTENILATGSVDESVKLWQEGADGLEQRHQLLGLELGVVSVAVDGSGRYGAASGLDSTINVWSQADYSAAARFKQPPAEAWALAWAPDLGAGRLLLAVAGGASNTVSLLDVGAQLAGEGAEAAGGDAATVLRLPGGDGSRVGAAPGGGRAAAPFVLSTACSPDGRWVVAGAMDGGVHLFDAATGQLVRTLAGHHRAVRGLAFTPDSRHILTACDDMHSNLYDAEQGHESWVLSVAVHPDGSAAVTGSSDAKVRLWDLGTRTLAQTVADHSDQVWSVAFRADGAKLASASDDHAICVYDFQ